jgi:hypothetical protein
VKLLEAASLAQLAAGTAKTEGTRSQIMAQVDPGLRQHLKSKKFLLARVAVNRLAAPIPGRGLSMNGPVVVDINAGDAGKTKTGYTPPVIVVSGHKTFKEAYNQDLAYITAWVGSLAASKLGIHADHALGSEELRSGLLNELKKRFGSTRSQMPPMIREVYPFESYAVYEYDNVLYRQSFTADPIAKTVALSGAPLEVTTRYTDRRSTSMEAAAFLHACACQEMGAQTRSTPTVFYAGDGKKITIDKIVTRYKAACDKGYKPRMNAKSPPGWERTVEDMKDHSEIDNPWALAWWMKNEGYQSRK